MKIVRNLWQVGGAAHILCEENFGVFAGNERIEKCIRSYLS
ncbi:MAG: hypothetical protein R3274_05970 [Desulfobacterales bacterium]|nr:hypothetical protein [Desulfobacterales bacterium]